MSQLLPEDVDSLADCPYPLHQAILYGLRWLQFEDFAPEERPPKKIWLDQDAMSGWWSKVEKDREDKYKSSGSTPEYDEDDYEENAISLVKK